MSSRGKSAEVLLSSEAGRRELLLGNEAVVRGAIEAGVGVVSGYPGTPASEVGDTFFRLQRELGIWFEYSVNEKIALEVAFGASLTGTRALVSMKHLGLSSAADPLSTMPYIGVVGGLVIVSAADPGCLTSPNEQDQRHLGRMMGIPTLDPATPEEARAMTAFAFQLSEGCQLPVLLRMTTRVCHTRAPVALGALSGPRPRGVFRRDPSRFLPTPVNARRMREVLQVRLDKACDLLTASPFNPQAPIKAPSGAVRRGLIATGAARNSVRELITRNGWELPLLELGALHPLPHALIVPFLRELDEVLVVEELTPYLEDSLLAIAHHHGVAARIHGKRDGQMPWPFELEPDEVEARMRSFLGLPASVRPKTALEGPPAPARPPVLCAGCPHRNTFHAVTAVFGEKAVYVNDIGCYTLGANPPHNAGDVLLAMGSSVPMAAGIARATGERVVAFIGDSSFFHSGMPAVLNAVQNDDDVVLVVMDNDITAMTGFQPSPGTSGVQSGTKRHIAQIARAIGVKDVVAVDPADLPATLRAMESAKRSRHFSVVVAEGPCAVLMQREGERAAAPPSIDPNRCHTCGMSESGLYCELAPSLAVQRRMAIQRADGPVPLSPLPGEGPSRGMLQREPVPETSPCSLECPLGICIPAYVGAIAAGEPERALQAVTLRAALPSVCSHICHRPCEAACVHSARGSRAIAVNELKRYLTERHAASAPAVREPPPGAKVAVVGAGPAGLAAARELVRRGYAPTLFDSRERPGGMLEYAIPEHRLPREVLRRDIAAVLSEGVRFEGGARLGDELSLGQLRERGFKAVLLALGAQHATRPPIPGAQSPHTSDALAFLAAPVSLAGEQVVVVGGGDAAVDVARVALRQGAARVSLLFPEPQEQMAAAPDTVQAAQAEGVALLPGWAALEVRERSLATGKVVGFSRGPAGVRWERTEERSEVPATRVIFATGQRPALEELVFPEGLAHPSGRLQADQDGRTVVPWLFVAGDVATGPSTVTAAMAAGVRAAYAIDEHLLGRPPERKKAAPPPRPAAIPHRAPVAPLSDGPLSEAAALAEAQRCFLCGMCRNCNTCVELLGCPAIAREGREGSPRVLAENCNSCGACVQACPNGAIG